jgi:hypothetical protein
MVDVIPIQYEPGTTAIKRGYYKVDDSNMATVPYGYDVDPKNPTSIIPITETAKQVTQTKLKSAPNTVPKNGEFLADGYYLATDSSLGVLPPTMMPAVDSLSISENKLSIKYAIGYVSEYVYYKKTYIAQPETPKVLPAGIYYNDQSKKTVSFLLPGKIADLSNGYGYTDPTVSPDKPSFDAAVKNYRDVSNNYDVQYHEPAEDLLKKSDIGSSIDASGGIRVKDASGNWVILPRLDAQASPIYYQPGLFVYGTTKYVPSYADSVYLSSWTKEPEMAPYTVSKVPEGVCKVFKDTPSKIEEYCAKMDANVCASTSCCVLLGGSKCVAGNKDGPSFQGHYSDTSLMDKDRYYYNGSCYGNCPK